MIEHHDSDVLHIVYALDARIMQFCLASMYSIVRRKKPSTKLNFFVLEDRFNDSVSFEPFNKLENVQVNIVPCDAVKLINSPSVSNLLGMATYLKIILPCLDVFKNLHRILYIDADLFARKDLYNSFHTSLDGFSIGMVKDASGVLKKGLDNWPSEDRYFHQDWFCNTGWILMDLDKLRKNQEHMKWLSYARSDHVPNSYEQGIINYYCHYDVKLLGPAHQLAYHNIIRYRNTHVANIRRWNEYYDTHYDSIDEMVRDSYFWHFHENKAEMMKNYPDIRRIITAFINEYEEFAKTGQVAPWTPESDAHLYVKFT